MQPRLLRVFRLAKLSSNPLRSQQVVGFSVPSNLGRQQLQYRSSIRISERQQGAEGPISPETLNSATNARPSGQEAIKPTALSYENAVRKSPVADRDQKRLQKRPKRPKDGLRGMKGHQRFLYWKPSICYRQGTVQTADALEQEKPSRVAAEKFFEHQCQLLYSAESYIHHTENNHIPEIVVLGASNAGKSSFLNALIGGVEMAKVSHRPGKTTTMNAYGVGPRPKIAPELIRKGDAPPKHSLILMDTPGYGFKSQADWGQTIIKYLSARKMLRGAVVLIPADKKLQDIDRWILKTLSRTNTRTLVVITKADKCGEGWMDACLSLSLDIENELQKLEAKAPDTWRDGSDRTLSVYATAAKMDTPRRLGNGAGLGGVRLAMLELAGFSSQERIEKQPETKAYTGPIVSFDDIVWK